MNIPNRNTGIHTYPSEGMIRTKKTSQIIRWYVLSLPVSRQGYYSGNPNKGLQIEIARRIRSGEPTFEYFAPSYVEVCEKEGILVNTHRPLLYNYVFVHASESEIFRIKQFQPQYNFLPRIQDSHGAYFPYISDDAMENLKWVARSYADILPVYMHGSEFPMKGDRIRVTKGQFKGVEANVVIRPGGGKKRIMVCVEHCMYVPLLSVESGQYEVLALNRDNRHVYTRMDNERLSNGLHAALQRHHSTKGVTEQDKHLAEEVLCQYENLQLDSDIMRSKLYAMLLPAYTILGRKEKQERLIATIQHIIPLLKAKQARALLAVTLYGCINTLRYHDLGHSLVDEWKEETNPKRNRSILVQRLADYDRWFGHE